MSTSKLATRHDPVVASSALLGYMAGPQSLGIKWDPERFDVSI